MEKIKRTQRIAALTRILTENPNTLFTLNDFCGTFHTAKSTMSEDIAIVENALRAHHLGVIETLPGAAGGVRYKPRLSGEEAFRFVSSVSDELCAPSRQLMGGYLYWSDILSSPSIVRRMGAIVAAAFQDAGADFVLTMETKGIPFALMTAGALGIPLVIARRSSKVYEGSAVNINYVSGRGSIETMALSRRAVREGQKALIVDDFIRAGGTARGMISLMEEFSVSVVGTAFMLAQENVSEKQVSGDRALMLFSETEDGKLLVRPAPWISGLEKGETDK